MSIPLPPGAPPGGAPPGMPPLPPAITLLPQEFFQRADEGMDIAFPFPQRNPPPTIDQIIANADLARTYWQQRDQRMDDDDNRYNMVATQNASSAGEQIVRNIPYVVVEKAATMLGAQLPTISVPPPQLHLQDSARKVEDLLRFAWEEWEHRWHQPKQGILRRAMAHYLALRGWLAIRVQYDPYAGPDDFPVKLFLVDPRNVYPDPSDDRINFVVHRASITVATAKNWFEEAVQVLGERSPTDKVEMISYYDDTYNAVLIDGQAIKPPTPHDYGFVPWIVSTALGAPAMSTSSIDKVESTQNIGPSMFHGAKAAMDQMDKVLSQLATQVAKDANPPIAVMYDKGSGRPKRTGFDAGDTNYLIFGKEAVQVLHSGASPADIGPLMQALHEDIQRATLPDILWGGDPGNSSGFAISIMSGAAKDALFSMVRTLELIQQEINTYALRLIRDFHPNPVGLIVKDPTTGQYTGGAVVTPQEIGMVGLRNYVKYKDLAPKDKFAMMQIGLAALDKKALSMEKVREDYFGVENPELENQRILDELIYQDQDFMKQIGVPYSLWKNNPDLFNLWMNYQQIKLQQQQQMAQMAQQMAPPGGAPPGLPPGAPHNIGTPGMPPVPGQPPMPTPAAMAPSPFNQLHQAAGSAAGAAGLQRLPGVAGFSGQLPGGLGVR